MGHLLILFIILLCFHTIFSLLSKDIDTGLYSRQLLVYGKSAQSRLSRSRIAIFDNGLVTQEVVKNLALAGVERMTIVSTNHKSTACTTSGFAGTDLQTYAASLNPNVEVNHMTIDNFSKGPNAFFANCDASVIIGCGETMEKLIELDALCRKHKRRLIAVKVYGASGFVFNDLSDHEILDVDGETYKEVPIADCMAVDNENFNVIRVTSVEEESLSFGIGDKVQILSGINKDITVTGMVTQVINPKICIVQLEDSNQSELLKTLLKQGKMSILKMKTTQRISHEPLTLQLLNPKFSATNGCLSPKQDRAVSLTLLAAITVFDQLRDRRPISASLFRRLVVKHLQLMNITDPLLSIKKGGKVGEEWLDYVLPRFHQSAKGICPATVSVLGSMAAQETIKVLTQMYSPVSQFLMFESFDSLHPATNNNATNTYMSINATTMKEKLHLLSVYHPEVLHELAHMKVFIVGSGAIGCELLKTFALLGIGEGEEGIPLPPSLQQYSLDPTESVEANSLWDELHLTNGGILITDNDQIEKSNLNRQLLFREQHIGQFKSLVAAQQVKAINNRLQIHALQMKISNESESLFTKQFWEDCDVVVTALDNIQARQYVDEQCLKYKTFLLDSGTLGMKANSQVIIPYLTETYSSSSDPPEEAIPLCTLKSFPYQSEHCIAWAKSLFQQYFHQDINHMQTYQNKHAHEVDSAYDWLQTLSPDDVQFINQSLQYYPCTLSNALQWAIQSFTQKFTSDIESLLTQHPMDAVDEEGNLFWSGSKRIPKPIIFNITNPLHRQYIVFAAYLRLHAFGIQSYEVNDIEHHAMALFSQDNDATVDSRAHEHLSAADKSAYYPMEFEKDDLTLGHVQFVQAAANLRNEIYGIRQVDLLETQKVAGNIIPAIATTTSLIAGMVTLELVKIASERVLYRKQLQQTILHGKLTTAKHPKKNAEKSQTKIIWRRIGGVFVRQRPNQSLALNISSTTYLTDSLGQKTFASYLRQHKDRILKRFRNSFINLARPILAFTQPMEAEESHLQDVVFNLWDDLPIPMSLKSTTISDLDEYIQQHYHLHIKSIFYGDQLLYADFLPPLVADEQSTLSELLTTFNTDINTKDLSEIKLDVICTKQQGEADGEEEEEEEFKLPPVVFTKKQTLRTSGKKAKKGKSNRFFRMFFK